jgi:hypothetical protein
VLTVRQAQTVRQDQKDQKAQQGHKARKVYRDSPDPRVIPAMLVHKVFKDHKAPLV